MNKDIIYEYYLMALRDLEEGATLAELEHAIELYEQEEMYEECAGILKAINEVKYDRQIKRLYNDNRRN